MSDHEAERRAFWDAVTVKYDGNVNDICEFADLLLSRRDKRFPPPAKEAAPEQDELVACPVCGKQPEWNVTCSSSGNGFYNCTHKNTLQYETFHNLSTYCRSGTYTEPDARAAWNSMRCKA